MDFSLLGMGMSFLASMFGMQINEPSQVLLMNEPVEYTCDQHVWSDGPRQSGSKVVGRLEVNCEFKAVSGGGFAQLNDYMIEKVKNEAQTIHTGPRSETYQGLPSTYYDATVVLGKGDTVLTARQDAHIATDLKTKLLFDTLSKQLRGTGIAEYLRKVDVKTAVLATGEDGVYEGELEGYFEIDKPWFVPANVLINQLKSEVDKRIDKVEKSILTEIGNNL